MQYTLRNLEAKDVEYMIEWMHDKEINRNFSFNAEGTSYEDALAFIQNSQKDTVNKHFAIVDENDEYIGTISLKNISHKNKNAEYAIALRKNAIGRGVAAVATNQVLEIAFEQLELTRVYLNVLSENTRAIRFYEKIGFEYEGEFKRHLFKDGQLKNLKWYAILKGDINE